MVGTIADKAVCTETTAITGGCSGVGSCCLAFGIAATPTTSPANSVKVCFPAGNAVTAALAMTAAQNLLAYATATDAGNIYPLTPCAAASGASTLAVSAAALATAVYMM